MHTIRMFEEASCSLDEEDCDSAEAASAEAAIAALGATMYAAVAGN